MLIACTQASSLDERCNADKHRYDTCFNHWLKSYLVLVAPPIDAPLDTVQGQRAREQRLAEIEKSKKELDAKCGSLYEAYQSCVWVCPGCFDTM